jgi:lysozyme
MQTFEYSKKGLALTEGFEGLRLKAYQDVAGVWTVGFGHTGTGVRSGVVITEAEAEVLLHSDIAASVSCVNSAVHVELNQNQFDALVDFCFNVGRGNFLRSALLRRINAGDFAGAAEQFGAWVYAGGEVVSGLVRRREVEAALFREASVETVARTEAGPPRG